MVKYKREILSIYVAPKKDDLLNVVSRVTWRWTAIEDFSAADIYVDTVFSTIDPNNFIDYSELTADVIFEWIDQVENLDELKTNLHNNLVSAKDSSKPIERNIPWNTVNPYTGTEQYLIVLDEKKENIIGPFNWNSSLVNKDLKLRGIEDFEFPDNITMYRNQMLPSSSSILVNDRIRLYRVEYGELPAIDETFQRSKGIEWDFASDLAVPKYIIEDLEIDQIKKNLVDFLSSVSNSKQNATINYVYNDQTITLSTTIDVRFNLTQKWIMMSETDTVNEKIGGVWLELSKQELKNILNAIDSHMTAVSDWEKNKFDEIMAADNIEQLREIELT